MLLPLALPLRLDGGGRDIRGCDYGDDGDGDDRVRVRAYADDGDDGLVCYLGLGNESGSVIASGRLGFCDGGLEDGHDSPWMAEEKLEWIAIILFVV